jgi:ATP-dependent DNA helicase RecQ
MSTAVQILKKYWGYPAFRPPQDEIIEAVLQGNDVLALLPTGAGKSICYQVPALMKDGLCLVISPLIALMKDQVQQLKRRDVPAAAIFSGLKEAEIDGILNNCAVGHYKLLYVSPERLASERFLTAIRGIPLSMLAVDEAHCISQWGHDFRPSYRDIAHIRLLFPGIPVMALTASATPKVQQDIADVLELKQGFAKFQSSYARPNISFAVREHVSKPEKILEIINKVPGTAIVYVRNRRRTEDIAKYLDQNSISATFYHAGLSSKDRNSRQEAWISGKFRVMCCTNAFGMGIDKPDVRLVIHVDVPESLEAYYQEAGRAGRDGKKSYAVLLVNQEDKDVLNQSLALRFPDLATVRRVYNALYNYLGIAFSGGKWNSFEFNIYVFTARYKLDLVTVYNSLKLLEQSGYLQMNEAFSLPSRITMQMDKSSLYGFQVAHADLDQFIKILLRTYEGIFGHYAPISEQFLANKLKLPLKEIERKLGLLAKYKVITYIPASDVPRITFLEERLPEDLVRLDHNFIAFSKEQMSLRIASVMNYAEASPERCRQVLMQEYFGETDAKACGKCDLCLHRKQLQQTPDLEEMRKRLLRKVSDAGTEGLVLKSFLASVGVSAKEHYLEVLRILLDEQQLCWINEQKQIIGLPDAHRMHRH